MTYLILSQGSETYAANLSAAIYALSAHPSSSGTAYAVPWQTNPVTGKVALHLTGDQYLQPEADIAAFVSLLPIPQGEADDLLAKMEAARGTRLSYVDMLPPSLAGALVDRFGPVPINGATSDDLQTLEGVGPSLAQAIIDGRPWVDPADLSQIDGISADMVDAWAADPGLAV